MTASYESNYRPYCHFSPAKGWINDPNGLLYRDGTWHMFFQLYPGGAEHGPMHWGHATSTDLVNWEQRPLALAPQGSAQIFSGSAVVDYQNTSGFGTVDNPPVVAIYTAHDTAAPPAKAEAQALAYSLDGCVTWTQYPGNPVLVASPEQANFRDPKVFWYVQGRRWIMVLAVGDRVHFYSSRNLKNWTFLSEFGAGCGAHAGVWECPDIFPLPVESVAGAAGAAGKAAPRGVEQKWVLLVSINPGGPNQGSATQYFVGDFDGVHFTLSEVGQQAPARDSAAPVSGLAGRASPVRWLDWGRDNYASVLFGNTPLSSGLRPRRIMIGWMSNWDYAASLPTKLEGWLGQMTVARELSLAQSAEGYVLKSYPVPEFLAQHLGDESLRSSGHLQAGVETALLAPGEFCAPGCQVVAISLEGLGAGRSTFTLSNGYGGRLYFGLDDTAGAELFIDRRHAGHFLGDEAFAAPVMTAPLPGGLLGACDLLLVFDKTSLEMFVNGGERVMTALYFPGAPFTALSLKVECSGTTFSLEASRAQLDKHRR